ncbi:MAG: hypothetical protein HY695_29265 [Deltaproteobacteria bacterium]|nr:hypothetical protein [Deltaproteobacteria bacterium]
MANNRDGASYPNRKISETFFAFAAPLLEAVGPKATRRQVEEVLKIAFTVWNSVIYDTVNGNDHYVAQIRQLTANDPQSSAVLEQMITRKKTMFSDDQRVIGEYKLTKKPGEWHLWAEARKPKRTG